MTIDPRLLRTLLAVVREGSFSAAGRALNMSQPAVSMAIAQLEQSAGTRLVKRGKQEWGITQAGRILARRAEIIETVLDLAGREVALGMNEIEGSLIIIEVPPPTRNPRMPDTRWRRTSAAKSGPKRFHQQRTVS